MLQRVPALVLFSLAAACALTLGLNASEAPADSSRGIVPTDARGRPLNLDFEQGTLQDWTAEGDAFRGQPIEGDTVRSRRKNMASQHAGRFWVGTYEVAGDRPRGTLTSVPFPVTHPYASFLVAGGSHASTRVELVRSDDGQVFYRTSGDDSENLKRVVVDLTSLIGKKIFIRLVDEHSGGWGHLNFDDFRFHETKPNVPPRPQAPAPDVYAHAGLSPQEAAAAMTVPEGFQVTLFAGEPDVVQPIAMALDDRGRVWVAEAYSYPRRVPPEQAKDRILIFEDTDGDGRFDVRKVFIEGLNLVSGLEVGFGGVWVGAAPEFLFIPDRDGDDRPDGPPQVLLDGWGQQDTHETLNTFTWGPDGWLYGCHGVFTHSRVGRPGTPDAERVPIDAGIWRYHPTKHRFEVFAHGTSNPWGIDFNDRGQAFLTACVIPHLYHVVQGGRYERQAGQHFNPYTYDDIKTIADHRHYLGATPHSGNGRSDAAGGGHAHAGAMIYLGGAWPPEYRDSILMNNIHGARLNRDLLTPRGSGFVGSHAPDFLRANDRWSQILNFRYGPDGQVYMIDWYDKNQCHQVQVHAHDRTNGRIFKITYGQPRPVRVNLAGLSAAALVDELENPNDWYVRHARRLLQERGASPELRERMARAAFGHRDETRRLRSLWALHATGGLEESHIAQGLANESPYVRAWTIQLAAEDRNPSSATLARFAEMARSDPSPVVRLYLASALQRLPLEKRWEILEGLLQHGEDVADPNLPLMYWYAAEPLAAEDSNRAARLAAGARIPSIQTYMTRRIGAIGSPEVIAMLVDRLGREKRPAQRLELLVGINEALKGRRLVAMPAGWPEVYRKLLDDKDPQVRSQATALGVTFGDPAALETMRRVLADGKTPLPRRQEALSALLKARDERLPGTLHSLLEEPPLRGSALKALAAFEDAKTPEIILRRYESFTPSEKRDALNTLAARVGFARALLAAVEAKVIPASDLSADLVRQLRNLKDRALDEQIGRVWGTVRETSRDAAALIARYKAMLTATPSRPPDPKLGRIVFEKTCAQCHTLFGLGGKVGPELTGSNRADLDYLLTNVLDPSALIGKDYEAHVLALTDGRVLTGIIRSEDKDAITLVTANESLTLPKSEIEQRRPSDKSMMPDDLLKPLSEHEVRSLIAYLASPAQVPKEESEAEPAQGGKD
ncbi:MAG: c-type cytochrome [Isosphaeraceae bacterium]|nr:c-type cytochrome [Isosphaeraceae bacterium]